MYILLARSRKINKAYTIKIIDTGNKTNPANYAPLLCESPKFSNVNDINPTNTEIESHFKNVRSLAKKVFGSIFCGTLMRLSLRDPVKLRLPAPCNVSYRSSPSSCPYAQGFWEPRTQHTTSSTLLTTSILRR